MKFKPAEPRTSKIWTETEKIWANGELPTALRLAADSIEQRFCDRIVTDYDEVSGWTVLVQRDAHAIG